MTADHPDLYRRLPAVCEAVDRLCGELRQGLLAGLPANERFAIELLLREALTNAVVHGARGSGEVECEMRLLPGEARIRVADSGRGFEWNSRAIEMPDPTNEGGRGLQILRLYASEVRFSPQGNQVEVTRRFAEGGVA